MIAVRHDTSHKCPCFRINGHLISKQPSPQHLHSTSPCGLAPSSVLAHILENQRFRVERVPGPCTVCDQLPHVDPVKIHIDTILTQSRQYRWDCGVASKITKEDVKGCLSPAELPTDYHNITLHYQHYSQ